MNNLKSSILSEVSESAQSGARAGINSCNAGKPDESGGRMRAALRLLHILKLMPPALRKQPSSYFRNQLKELGADISLRTVQRDLADLSRFFPITSDDQTPPGYFWARDADPVHIPNLDPRSAIALQMVDKFLSNKLPPNCLAYLRPHFQAAHGVIEQFTEEGSGPWHEKVAVISRSQPLLAPEIHDEILNTVYHALAAGKKFSATYRRRGETEPVVRTVNPLGLVFADQLIYLVCTFFDYDDPEDVFFLALHRMQKAEPTEEPAATVEGFNLQEFIDTGAFGFSDDGERIRVKLLFSREAGQHLLETPLSPDQEATEKGKEHLLITGTAIDSRQLRWWIMGFGDQVEVLAPKWLRNEIAEIATGMAEIYRTPSRGD